MHVLIVTNIYPNPTNPTEGIFIYHRVNALLATGIKVTVIKLNTMINRQFKYRFLKRYSMASIGYEQEMIVQPLNILKIPFLTEFQVGRYLLSLVRLLGIDLVHYHFLWDALGSQHLYQAKIPYLLTCHGCDINGLFRKSNRFQAACIRRLKGASARIFVSKALMATALDRMPLTGINEVCYNGIDSSVFNLNSRSVSRPLIGFVGNLLPVKGADLLPEIIRMVKASRHDAEFVVLGQGPLLDDLKIQFQNNGDFDDVKLLGQVSMVEVARWMSQMQVMMLPSRQEGFPCVIPEAQACGVTVVASDVGGIPEAMAGEGVLVSPGADFTQRFADSVIQALDASIPTDRLVARTRLLEWPVLIKKEIFVYEQVLGRRF